MKLLIDAQLPPSLCSWFTERGHQAVHVADLLTVASPDRWIATLAEQERMIILSKDDDFLSLRHPDRFQLVWLRCGNITNRALRAWLDERWSKVEALLDAGEGLAEVR